MSLTTVEKVKSYLQISDSSDYTFIQDLVDYVTEQIENYCSRKFDVATYTETHMCKHKCFPRNTPLKSVISVIRDGMPQNQDTDFKIKGNYIQFNDLKGFTMGGSIVYATDNSIETTITYIAGYDTIPNDLAMAATKLAVIEYKDSRENRLGIEQETEGDVRYTYSKKDSEMPLNISRVLDRYRKVSL
ncbi:phage head-tail connector protein [Clostridium sp. JN-9]|uniref:phage head-tail connector protein n=1 Tax=Clostridium sp. JN-9 TaxID=2507159 RepID=UPI000FFE236E|nr:phage head-tail connector protein [Clostridium sp. JN-9]QAT40840.1 hypothetical protein EQM05_11520 [Clostridium sp. JN-9]